MRAICSKRKFAARLVAIFASAKTLRRARRNDGLKNKVFYLMNFKEQSMKPIESLIHAILNRLLTAFPFYNGDFIKIESKIYGKNKTLCF
jgi:hypothetical protein